jgi:hypothetical protein
MIVELAKSCLVRQVLLGEGPLGPVVHYFENCSFINLLNLIATSCLTPKAFGFSKSFLNFNPFSSYRLTNVLG